MPRPKNTKYDKEVTMTMAKNLKKILEEKGLTQKDLAVKTGLKLQTINDYVTGKTYMRPGSLQKIADALNVKKTDIDTTMKEQNSAIRTFIVRETEAFYNTKPVPIVGSVPAGPTSEIIEDITNYVETPEQILSNGDYFYLRISGDSMMGSGIYEGDLVLVKIQPDVEHNQIAVVRTNESEATLKRVIKKENGEVILKPDNPKYQPIRLCNSNAQIIGKVERVMFDPNRRRQLLNERPRN